MNEFMRMSDVLTLPMVGIELRIATDSLRKKFKASPELQALARRLGRTWIFRAEDLAAIEAILRPAA